MEDKQAAADAACEDLNFERSLAELETIVHDLEDGQLGLAEALARYEQGVKHLKRCYTLLEAAEQKIELLTSVANDGSAITEAFEESGGSRSESAGRRKRPRSSTSSQNNEKDDIGA